MYISSSTGYSQPTQSVPIVEPIQIVHSDDTAAAPLLWPARHDTITVTVTGPYASLQVPGSIERGSIKRWDIRDWMMTATNGALYRVLPTEGRVLAGDGTRIGYQFPDRTPGDARTSIPRRTLLSFGADVCAHLSLSAIERQALTHAVSLGQYPEEIAITRLDIAYDLGVSASNVCAGIVKGYASRRAKYLDCEGNILAVEDDRTLRASYTTVGGKRGGRKYDVAIYDAGHLARQLENAERFQRLERRGWTGGEVCRAEFRAYTSALKRYTLRRFGDITPQRLEEMMACMMRSYSPIVTPETAGRAKRHQRLTPEWQALCAQASCLDARIFEPPWAYEILESEEADGGATITLVCRESGEVVASSTGTGAEGRGYRQRRKLLP